MRVKAQHIKPGDRLMFWKGRTVITKEFKVVDSVEDHGAILVRVEGCSKQFALERDKFYTVERRDSPKKSTETE